MQKNANLDEIKRSYRALAHVYHPDKNQGNDIVSSYFTEIQEAYSVLSNSISKRVYDRERSRLGLSTNIPSISISYDFIQKELDQLEFISRSPQSVDVNKELVAAYLKFLFTKQNIAILISESEAYKIENILIQTLSIIKKLDYYFFSQIEPCLIFLANGNKELLNKIEKTSIEKQRQKLWIQILPFLVFIITGIICLVMYFYAKN